MKNIQRTLLIATLFASYSIAQAQGMIFSEVDTDKNGSVSEQEFNNARVGNIAARVAEGRQMRGLSDSPAFATIDTNSDGNLSPDEMQQMQVQQQSSQNRGQGQGKRGPGRPPQPVFADFDANNDTSISEQEYYDARNTRIGDRAKEGRQMRGLANIAAFSDIDTNSDGKITEEEFGLYRMEHMQKQGQKNQPRKN